jgi:hypothetical protein
LSEGLDQFDRLLFTLRILVGVTGRAGVRVSAAVASDHNREVSGSQSRGKYLSLFSRSSLNL